MQYSNSFLQNRAGQFVRAFALALLILFASMPLAGATSPPDKKTQPDEKGQVQAPKTYEECVAKYTNVSLSKMSNAIDKAVKTRTDKLADYTKKVEASNISDEQKQKLTEGMATDAAFITALGEKAKGSTDVKLVREEYCAIVYKTRVNTYRGAQATYVEHLGKLLARDGNFNTKLGLSYNNNFKGLLKDEINARTATARNLMQANLIAENLMVNNVVNATRDANGDNNLQKPDYATVNKNFQDAYRAYTESWVLKKAGTATHAQKDSTITLVSVALLDDKGNPAETKLRSVTQADAVLNVEGKQQAIRLERKPGQAWQVVKNVNPDSGKDSKKDSSKE